MQSISFKDTPELGGVVKKIKPFCKLTKEMTSVLPEYIMGDFNNPKFHGLAGHKWSRLCGFTFESNIADTAHSTFQIVYVPKLRATLARNDKALSGWYCWEVIADDHRNVLSIEAMKTKYKFDVTAFVHSDEFNKYVPIFVSNIKAALDGPVQTLLDSITDNGKKRELNFYINAIKNSLTEIYQVQKYIVYDKAGSKLMAAPDVPNSRANLAYNADKNYALRNLDKDQQKRLAVKRNKLKDALKGIKPNTQKSNDTEELAEPSKVKFDPSLKYKFGGGRTRKQDDEIFDKYDDYDNDDYR